MIALLTLPVLLYQVLFVAIIILAARKGRLWLNLALAACLAWTATHIFLVPLAVLQASVILTTYFVMRARLQRRRSLGAPPHS